ncbi:MAG: HAMP domain-containing histidine kinase [Acidobacteria bacterium]|nr:HAMP domain-containing histidine kinase [Acidobacteriota bacterium]
MPTPRSAHNEADPLRLLFLGAEGRTSTFARQLPLVLTMLVIGLLFSPVHPNLLADGLFVGGFVVLLVSLIAAMAVPWETLPPWLSLITPLLGFLAIGMVGTGSLGYLDALGVLCIFPMATMAVSHQYRGVALGLVCTLLVVGVPILSGAIPLTALQLSTLLIIPLVALAIGLAVALAVRHINAQATSIVNTSRDLEAAVRDSEEQSALLRSVLGAVDVGVVAIAQDGTPILANKPGLQTEFDAAAAAKNNGEPIENWYAMGEARKEIFEADQITPTPKENRPLARAIRGESYSKLLFWVNSNGRQLAFHATSRPIASPSSGYVVAFSEVTQLLEAAAAQASFAAAISHELRTPLTSILGYTDLLRDRLTEAGLGDIEELGVIERNAQRLQQQVETLIGTAQASINLAPLQTDLATLIESVVAGAQHLAVTRHVTLNNVASQQLEVHVDPARFSTALDAVLANAIKYGGQGEVQIRSMADDGGASVRIEIEDHGPGIELDDLERVFAQYYRSPAALASTVTGFGLGLSIAKAIIDAHGGTLTVSSTPGVGTVAAITLPQA